MPDHIHILLTVPECGSLSKIIGIYKRAVTFNLGRGPLWQSRFHVVLPKSMSEVIQYIEWNPVKEGICKEPKDYQWSSASGRWDIVPCEWS